MKALGLYDDHHQLIINDDNKIGMINNQRVLASMDDIIHMYCDGTCKCAPHFVTRFILFVFSIMVVNSFQNS